MHLRRFAAPIIIILLVSTIVTGLESTPTTARTGSGPLAAIATLSAAAAGPTSTEAQGSVVSASAVNNAKKYVVFRDDDIGFGNASGSSVEAVDQVHINENVPVTLAIIPHPNVCGAGNELLWNTPVNNYLRSIVTNPLFEFAQHGYNHYDYAQSGPPKCSASNAAGVPQVTGAAAPYYEVGESPGPGQLVGAGNGVYSEFWGRPYADQYNAIKQGRDDVKQAFNVTPTTFAPPWNKGDANTLKATAALGFTLYSTSIGDFGVQQAKLQGITVEAGFGTIGDWNTAADWQAGMKSFTQQADAALNAAPAGAHLVIEYHFWAFENPDGSVDPGRIALLKQFIDHLKSRGDVLFTTLAGQQFTSPSPAPAVCSADGGKTLDLFVRGWDNYLYWEHSADGGTTWGPSQSLGGYLTSAPAATSRNPGGITVFARGSDGGIWYRDYSGSSWGKWVSIGGQSPAGRAPAVSSWGGGRLDVVAQGTDGALWHKSYDTATSWSNWQSLGGSPTSSPAATSRNTGGITVFARGSDGALWHRTYDGTAWGKNWDSLGGIVTSSPAATAPGGSRIDVVVRGSDSGLWQKIYDGGWSAWTPITM
jgi:hypothetical protein